MEEHPIGSGETEDPLDGVFGLGVLGGVCLRHGWTPQRDSLLLVVQVKDLLLI
jgi:hypothetical protein